MIVATGLCKSYGGLRAVDDLSFTVRPGVVTGFLGPNGAGKSTTMRLMLGLDRGEGNTEFDGQSYGELAHPARSVGVLLDARAVHPGRRARAHLRMVAAGAGIPARRADEVLNLVGLGDAAGRRAGGFSLGMGQRLGLAGALLGDPGTLILDEPANGLDPEGVRWLRDLLKLLAAEGRTIFVSSHLLNEMAVLADSLVVVGNGRLIAEDTVDGFVRRNSVPQVIVRAARPDQLMDLLRRNGFRAAQQSDGMVVVEGGNAPAVGALAMRAGLVLDALTVRTASLEEAFFAATSEASRYSGHAYAGVGHPTTRRGEL